MNFLKFKFSRERELEILLKLLTIRRHISVMISISVEYPTNIQFPVTSSAKYSQSIPRVSFDFLRLSGKLGSF